MAIVDLNEAELVELLQDLIRINSVNPSLVPEGAGEGEIANYVSAHLTRLGLDVQLQAVAEGRPNVIAFIEGQRKGRSLMINCHMDTVSAEGMPDAFTPRYEHGRVYGRGALDTKGGLAAMLIAAKALVKARPSGDLILACVIDEEHMSIGTEALIKEWKADAAIVLEPTSLRVCTAHKGFVWLEVQTEGRAAHGGRPDLGIDAIMKMGRFLHELSGLEQALLRSDPHPLLGTGSLHASLISGGRELSSYPDRCFLQLERRTVPGETADKVSSEIGQIIERLQSKDPHFSARYRVMFQRDPYEVSTHSPVVKALCQAVADVTGRPAELMGHTAWMDSALLGAAGIPSVVFGPGGEGMHALVEYVNLDQVATCAEVLARSALGFLQMP